MVNNFGVGSRKRARLLDNPVSSRRLPALLFDQELSDGEAHDAFEAFDLGGVDLGAFGVLELGLGALHGLFDRIFIDRILLDGVLGEHGDLVALHLNEAIADD